MEPKEIASRARHAASGLGALGRRAIGNPASAVLTALVAGFVFGLVLRLFERGPRERGEK